jgi:hypothetical protein
MWLATNWAATPGPTSFQPYCISSQVSNVTTAPYLPLSPVAPVIYVDKRQGTDPTYVSGRSLTFNMANIRYFRLSTTNWGQYTYLSEIAIVVSTCGPGGYLLTNGMCRGRFQFIFSHFLLHQPLL